MKCRLTNEFKNFLYLTFTVPFWILLGIIVGVSALWGMAFVVGSTMMALEIDTWMSYVVHGIPISSIFDYQVSIGLSMLGYLVVFLILACLVVVLLGGVTIGIIEQYDEFKHKKRSLESKYERPFRWYHVILSYIITCEVSKINQKDK